MNILINTLGLIAALAVLAEYRVTLWIARNLIADDPEDA